MWTWLQKLATGLCLLLLGWFIYRVSCLLWGGSILCLLWHSLVFLWIKKLHHGIWVSRLILPLPKLASQSKTHVLHYTFSGGKHNIHAKEQGAVTILRAHPNILAPHYISKAWNVDQSAKKLCLAAKLFCHHNGPVQYRHCSDQPVYLPLNFPVVHEQDSEILELLCLRAATSSPNIEWATHYFPAENYLSFEVLICRCSPRLNNWPKR